MPAPGLLSTEHKAHGPRPWVTLTDTLGPGSSPPAASLKKPPGGPFLPTYSSGSTGLFLNHPHFPVTDPGDRGADQAPVLHWLPGSSEANGIQFVFYLFLNLSYVPILTFSSSFNPFQDKV